VTVTKWVPKMGDYNQDMLMRLAAFEHVRQLADARRMGFTRPKDGPHPTDTHVGKRVRMQRLMLGQSQVYIGTRRSVPPLSPRCPGDAFRDRLATATPETVHCWQAADRCCPGADHRCQMAGAGRMMVGGACQLRRTPSMRILRQRAISQPGEVSDASARLPATWARCARWRQVVA
jgi:hypothetical protein